VGLLLNIKLFVRLNDGELVARIGISEKDVEGTPVGLSINLNVGSIVGIVVGLIVKEVIGIKVGVVVVGLKTNE
jgi:hypothetical protein